jgi:hypothetical protein
MVERSGFMQSKDLSNLLEALPIDKGSKRRLRTTLTRLDRDEEHVLFDDRVVELAKRYEKRPGTVNRIIARLSRCVSSEDGLPFGSSVGRKASMFRIWEKFAEPEKSDFRWNKRFQAAIQKVSDRYKVANLEVLDMPKSYQGFRNLLPDWSTSGGWESITTGCKTKGEILGEEYIRSFAGKVDKAIADGKFSYPIVPGFRTQCTELPHLDCKHKKRPVNMVTLTVILAESLFANPINQFLTRYPYSAIGKDDVYDIPQFCVAKRMRGYHWLSLDYSNYDSTIPSWLIDASFGILKQCFPRMTERQSALWDVLVKTFVVKDIVIPPWNYIHVTHGNPSGSKFTAIINGVCNEIMTEYWADLLSRKVEYMIMGDDNLIFFTDGLPITKEEIERIADVLTSKIGISVNASKADHGSPNDRPKFLSRIWTDAGAWRPVDELVAKLAYPERYRNYVSGSITPELMLFSYILGCRAGMRDWLRVDDFLRENNLKLEKVEWTKEVLREVPYTIRTRVELERIRTRRPYLTPGNMMNV